jgi:hypothetical protein
MIIQSTDANRKDSTTENEDGGKKSAAIRKNSKSVRFDVQDATGSNSSVPTIVND